MRRRPRTKTARIWRAGSAAPMAPVARGMPAGEEVVGELGNVPGVPVSAFAEKTGQAVLLVRQIASREGHDLDRDRREAERGHPGIGATARMLDTGDLLGVS